jgi:hypothetical protein
MISIFLPIYGEFEEENYLLFLQKIKKYLLFQVLLQMQLTSQVSPCSLTCLAAVCVLALDANIPT